MIPLPYTLQLDPFAKLYQAQDKIDGLYDAWLINEQPDENGMMHLVGNAYDTEYNISLYTISEINSKDQDISLIKKNTNIAKVLGSAGHVDDAFEYFRKIRADNMIKDYITSESYVPGRVQIYHDNQTVQTDFFSDNKNVFCPESINEVKSNNENNIIEAKLWINRSQIEDSRKTYKYDDQGKLYQLTFDIWAWEQQNRKDKPLHISHKFEFDQNEELTTRPNEEMMSDFDSLYTARNFEEVINSEKENARKLWQNLKVEYKFNK